VQTAAYLLIESPAVNISVSADVFSPDSSLLLSLILWVR